MDGGYEGFAFFAHGKEILGIRLLDERKKP